MLTKIPEITICSSCNGWGFQNSPNLTCQGCRGKGVYIREENTELTIDTPHFVNIKARELLKIYRIIIKTILLITSLLLATMITITILQLFT